MFGPGGGAVFESILTHVYDKVSLLLSAEDFGTLLSEMADLRPCLLVSSDQASRVDWVYRVQSLSSSRIDLPL